MVTLWARLWLRSAVRSGVLMMIRRIGVWAIISVRFRWIVSSSRSVGSVVLVRITIQRFPIRAGVGWTVAVVNPSGRAIVAWIRGCRLGKSGRFLRRVMHGWKLKGVLEICRLEAMNPFVEYSSHSAVSWLSTDLKFTLPSWVCVCVCEFVCVCVRVCMSVCKCRRRHSLEDCSKPRSKDLVKSSTALLRTAGRIHDPAPLAITHTQQPQLWYPRN